MSIPAFSTYESLENFIKREWKYSVDDYKVYWDFVEHYFDNEYESGVELIPFDLNEKEQIRGYN
jgi:hypothetical protein